ncbi:MAG: F0F1 ATP synthase subunit A [Lachnospiraceae bacterium]|nr:F0F1 ATP synthase subunit A [Lachnospiraceae bacterium]
MSKKRKCISAVVFGVIIVLLLIGIFAIGAEQRAETIRETMKDAVLHESVKISFLGIKDVNPAVISAYVVTGIIFVFALIVRIFFIPKFKIIPGKFQMLLEEAVGMFDGLAKGNSPHRNSFLGAYIFTAGGYIFIGTLFELLGVQAISVSGHPVSLPAPLADINGAISLGVLSYTVILSGGIVSNGIKGVFMTLKDFSLPISMSFRLFGALLSGALVTELVYYSTALSFVLPVFVAVLFTLLHALIQAYVLTMLTSIFYGEVSEKSPPKPPKEKKKKDRQTKTNDRTFEVVA